MKITDIPLEARYYFNAERTMGREVREGRFDGATEYWHCHGYWHKANHAVVCDSCGKFWSRPIDVGEGWKLVGLDESIQEGDEYFDGFSKWSASANPGLLVRESVIPCKIAPYRRRKKPEQSDEWVSVKDHRPPKDDMQKKWLCYFDYGLMAEQTTYQIYCAGMDSHLTHWMPLPKRPAPDKTDAEAAWEKHSKLPWFSMTCKEHYLAGYAAGKEAR